MKLLCRTQTARGTRYDSTLPYCINFWRNQKGSRNSRFFTHSENRCLVIDVNQVVDEVNRLADKLVAYLCDSQTIQECRVAWGLQSFCYTGPTSNLDLTTSKLRKLCQDLLSFCICFPIYIYFLKKLSAFHLFIVSSFLCSICFKFPCPSFPFSPWQSRLRNRCWIQSLVMERSKRSQCDGWRCPWSSWLSVGLEGR